MKARTIVSLIIIVLGVLVYLSDAAGLLSSTDGGFAALLIGLPLILIGIFLLFSYIGSALIFLGIIVHLIIMNTAGYSVGPSTHLGFVWYIGIIIFLIGIVYGLAEGIIKLINKSKKKR